MKISPIDSKLRSLKVCEIRKKGSFMFFPKYLHFFLSHYLSITLYVPKKSVHSVFTFKKAKNLIEVICFQVSCKCWRPRDVTVAFWRWPQISALSDHRLAFFLATNQRSFQPQSGIFLGRRSALFPAADGRFFQLQIDIFLGCSVASFVTLNPGFAVFLVCFPLRITLHAMVRSK